MAIKTPSTVTEETETRLVEDLSLERALVLSIISCSEKNYLRNRFRKGQHSLNFRSGNLRHYEITERLRVMQWDNGIEGGIRKNLTNLYLLSYFKTCQFYEILQIYCETFFWKARPWAELRFPSILRLFSSQPLHTCWQLRRKTWKLHHPEIFCHSFCVVY